MTNSRWARWKSKLWQHPAIQRSYTFLRTKSLPGFKGVSILKIITFIHKEMMNDDVTTRANSMAFSFFISLFPFLIIIFSVLSLFPQDTVEMTVRGLIENILPTEAQGFIIELLTAMFSRGRVDLLSIGFVLALYFSSNGMEAMMRGFHKGYEITFKQRNWIERRATALRLTLMVGILTLLALAMIIGSSLLLEWLKARTLIGGWTTLVYKTVQWIIILSLFYSIIATIYRYAPPLKKRFSFFSIGTNFATLFSLLSSLGFTYYVNTLGNYDNFYGPLGTIIMLLLWIQINCYILLMGFELNAGIAVHSDIEAYKRSKLGSK